MHVIIIGSSGEYVRRQLARVAEAETAYAKTKTISGTDKWEEDDEDSTYNSSYGSSETSTTATCIDIASAFCEYEKIFDDIQEFIRRARAEEGWRYENKRHRYAPASKTKPVMACLVIRPIFNRPALPRRMMFPVSGHLPWRDRKKLKDR